MGTTWNPFFWPKTTSITYQSRPICHSSSFSIPPLHLLHPLFSTLFMVNTTEKNLSSLQELRKQLRWELRGFGWDISTLTPLHCKKIVFLYLYFCVAEEHSKILKFVWWRVEEHKKLLVESLLRILTPARAGQSSMRCSGATWKIGPPSRLKRPVQHTH